MKLNRDEIIELKMRSSQRDVNRGGEKVFFDSYNIWEKFQGVQQLYLLLSEENVYIKRQVVAEKNRPCSSHSMVMKKKIGNGLKLKKTKKRNCFAK